MIKSIVSLALLFFTSTLFAQEVVPTINPCATEEHTARLAKLLEFQQNYYESQQIKAQEGIIDVPKGVVLKIPIVFHILHDGGESNISREQVLDGLRILNEDYRMLNPGISDVSPEFAGLQADIEVEFVLATIAPNGECFTGITRTYDPVASNDGNENQVLAIRQGNDVYNGDWPGDMYLNVFVVGTLSDPGSQLITLGYTTYPAWGGTTMSNGFHVIHQCIGSIGTGGIYDLATSTHEIGHWLDLPHTWGGTNTPGCDGTTTDPSDPCYQTNNCNSDDGVDDTPSCIGIQGGPCNHSSIATPLNSCNNDNAYWGGYDMPDNIDNYMDYAHCSRMFTQGQADVMRDALTSSVGGRNNLWTQTNLDATGANGTVIFCKAEFSADVKRICVGDQVQFSDLSYNVVSGWTWTFDGGSPAISTDQNPAVIYNTPGLYTVTLNASDGSLVDDEVKTAYIRVLPAGAQLPIVEGFENISTLTNIVEWEVSNGEIDIFSSGGNMFELETSFGRTGNQCVRLLNNGEEDGNVDELLANPVDLSGISGSMTLSFRYAYKRRNSNDNDWLRVLVTDDCGDSWLPRKTLHGFQLSTETQTSAFVPSSIDDWTTIHMTNITSSFWVDNFGYKFGFEAGGGNNIYLDDINIYAGSPSDDIVVGLNDGSEIGGLNVYPNPVEDELNVQFSVASAQKAVISIQDVSGKSVQQHLVQANEGSNMVFMDTKKLASGMYFLNIQLGNSQRTIQFVVK
ncbi:MAG: M43 family zinc metalloprotease [Crocinitomicaceae bacterium]|nr:M43 family zinc metalloprotease [Crocinitomicaceae bacterium]